MKNFIFVIIINLLIILVSSSAKQCYEEKLNFNDVSCSDNQTRDFSDFLIGKSCREIACVEYLEDQKTQICIHQKKREFKLMIFGERSNQTFDISTFKDDENYTINRIAISGNHISLLLISLDAAYRMSFNIKDLYEQDTVSLKYMGHVDNIIWEAFNDSDVYMESKGSGTAETIRIPHDENKNDVSYHNRCVKFNDESSIETTTTTTIANMPSVVVPNKIVITDKNAIFFSVGACFIVIILCGTAAYVIIKIHNRKQSIHHRNRYPLTNSYVAPPPYRTCDDVLLSSNYQISQNDNSRSQRSLEEFSYDETDLSNYNFNSLARYTTAFTPYSTNHLTHPDQSLNDDLALF